MTELLPLIINAGAKADIHALEQAFAEAGRPVRVHRLRGKRMQQTCARIVQQAGGAVVVAGGDGTVNTVAALCAEHGVTLGVVPLGTFNYFAREHGITTDIAEAAKIIAAGNLREVPVGLAGKQVFLNNASFGLYARLIRQREKASGWLGRFRLVAAVMGAYSLFYQRRAFDVEMHTPDGSQHFRTSLVFVGNNTLQLENLGLQAAECTKAGKLAVIIMKEVTHWQVMKLILRGLLKNLQDRDLLHEICAEDMELTLHGRVREMVVDGEIMRAGKKLKFTREETMLRVFVP